MRNREVIAIRSIQHFLYCSHRWGLVEINRSWAENIYVTKANIMHERVHDPDYHYITKGKKVFTSVPVYNDKEEYDLYGIVDCLELVPDDDGVCVDEGTDKYKLCIVEYKPTIAKNNGHREEDLMQVFAQKLCVDAVFDCDCEAVLYYGDVKRRYQIDFKENYSIYDSKLRQILSEMRQYLRSGTIPTIRDSQNCSGCSMKDLCMPKLKRVKSFKEELNKLNGSK